MERLKNLDWAPSVEDIVDDKYLDEERLQKESAMYSIMNGNFQDPFQHLRPHQYYQQKGPKSAPAKAKTKPKESAKTPSLGVAVKINKKKRGRPKKNSK